MKDIIADLKRWKEAGKTDIALATIVETRGSSLRPAGTRMAITADGGDIAGSVSSGCVDGDAVAEMEAVLASAPAIRRPFFGVSDEAGVGRRVFRAVVPSICSSSAGTRSTTCSSREIEAATSRRLCFAHR